MTLRDRLAALDPRLLDRLRARGFDAARLERLASSLGDDRDARNRLPGVVEPPAAGDVDEAPAVGTALHDRTRARGVEAIRAGEVALSVLAGGMATRMGGVVKTLVEVLPGKRFLDVRLAENDALTKLGGRPFPLWFMTSEATEGPIREALGARLEGRHLATFEQCVSLRLTPSGDLFVDERGEPSVYSTGHGDLPDALRSSGLLEEFVARGGKTVCVANVDNLGATVDPAIVGWHLEHGADVTVEVVDKVGSDKGGGPVRWNGKPIITEEFRVPKGFDLAQVPVFNTNTFLVSARALLDLRMEFTWVLVEKKIGEAKALQFERLLGEITAPLSTRFLRVPRSGSASRFLPVKDIPELEKRRSEIEAVARARGLL